MHKKVVYLLALIILAQCCAAARIHGTVYDLSLERAKNVVVSVNSSPMQRLVAKEGEYAFTLPAGNYQIRAEEIAGNQSVGSADENLSVVDEGEYVLDLFLFPSFGEEIASPDITIPEDYLRTTNYLLAGVLVVLLLVLVVGILLYVKTRKNTLPLQKPQIVIESGDELQKVVGIIRAQGGRTTQKDIRKELPYSEAKVSLIIAELEAKGIVEKIKKGRGNIVILKQN